MSSVTTAPLLTRDLVTESVSRGNESFSRDNIRRYCIKFPSLYALPLAQHPGLQHEGWFFFVTEEVDSPVANQPALYIWWLRAWDSLENEFHVVTPAQANLFLERIGEPKTTSSEEFMYFTSRNEPHRILCLIVDGTHAGEFDDDLTDIEGGL